MKPPSVEEADRVAAWLESKGFKCPACGEGDDFSLGGTIAVPNLSASAEVNQGLMTSFITVTCDACAFVSMFSPKVMRIPVE